VSGTLLARDLMSRPVKRLTASASVRDAAAFLTRNGISGAPVIDARGRWIGVFTLRDLARHLQDRLVREQRRERTLESREPVVGAAAEPTEDFGRTSVKELMTKGMFTVFPESTLDEVVRSMVTYKIHRLFVIDEATGALEGVITTFDVLKVLNAKTLAHKL